jgi:hypothetical protein
MRARHSNYQIHKDSILRQKKETREQVNAALGVMPREQSRSHSRAFFVPKVSEW